MPRMRGLTILVAGADGVRFRAALELAAAQAALGGRARIHLLQQAVGLLAAGGELQLLRAEAIALGVEISACQTGLSANPDCPLPDGVEADGMIGLLSRLDDDRLLTF